MGHFLMIYVPFFMPKNEVMFNKNCSIIENLKLSTRHYILRLDCSECLSNIHAGQFFILEKIGENSFDIPLNAHYVKDDILEVYYEVNWQCADFILALKQNDKVNIKGPFGNSFSTDIKNKNVLVISEGMGISPMRLLIDSLKNDNNLCFIHGAYSKDGIKIISDFDLYNVESYITTEDGSIGLKANVFERMVTLFEEKKCLGLEFDKVYICASKVMTKLLLNEVLKTCKDAEVCFDAKIDFLNDGVNSDYMNYSIETKEGIKRVYYDGQVFHSNSIILDR